jgi:hypothetical protein
MREMRGGHGLLRAGSLSTSRWSFNTFTEPREVQCPCACHCFPQHTPVHPRPFTPDLPLAELPSHADYCSCGQVARI